MTVDRVKNNVAFFCDLPGCLEGLETDRAIAKVVARHDGTEPMPPATPDDYRFLGDLEPAVAAIFIILMRGQERAHKQLHDLGIAAFNAGAR